MSKQTQFVYSADVTNLEGKQGKLKQDKDGYFEVLVGAFNAYNSAGEFYNFTSRVNALYAKSSLLMQRVRSGKQYGEADHPSIDPYLGKDNMMALWMDRLREIRAKEASHHIKQYRLADLPRQEKGRTVVGVYAELKPLDERLLGSLNNPHENTSFSQRAFSDNILNGYELQRNVTEVVTHDWVTAGGIPDAAKYRTPSLESMFKSHQGGMDIVITPQLLNEMEKLEKLRGLVAMEESNIIPVTRIRDVSGWREVPTLDLGFNEEQHLSRRW